jgi:hypothetical protein
MTLYAWLLAALVVVGVASGGAGGALLALAGVVLAAARCAWRDDRPVGYAGMLPRYVR